MGPARAGTANRQNMTRTSVHLTNSPDELGTGIDLECTERTMSVPLIRPIDAWICTVFEAAHGVKSPPRRTSLGSQSMCMVQHSRCQSTIIRARDHQKRGLAAAFSIQSG